LKTFFALSTVIWMPAIAFAFQGKMGESAPSIHGLVWNSNGVEIERKSTNEVEVYALLKGSFHRSDAVLVANGHLGRPDAAGKFEFSIELKKPHTLITIDCISDRGTSEEQIISIDVNADTWASLSQQSRTSRKWAFDTGFGLSSIHYLQSNVAELDLLALNVNLDVERFLKTDESWSMVGGLLLEALPISDNLDSGLRFFDWYGGAKYLSLPTQTPWRWSIIGGYASFTTIGQSTFGYSNLGGLEISPSIRYYLKKGDFFSFGAKYVLLVVGASASPFSSRDFEMNLTFEKKLAARKSFSLSAGFQSLDALTNLYGAEMSAFATHLSYCF
jgi:hypothetical protein